MDDHQKLRVVELFAGVGGFRVGLERCSSRFDTVWANQWEPGQVGQWAHKCYLQHFEPGANCHNADISTVVAQVPEHDLLVGGFPCQDYSVAQTQARGIEGKKGVLWWSIDDILRLRRPAFALLENVDRLLRSPAKQRGRDFGIILRCLHDLGYAAEWRVINAADYGNAQRRRRTFLFAYHRDTALYAQRAALPQGQALSWLTTDGFFAGAFPVEGTPVPDKLTRTDLGAYSDLLDMTARFQADFHNGGAMLDGSVFSAELIPAYEPPTPLSQILEGGDVAPHLFLTGPTLDTWAYLKGAKKIQRVSKATGFEYTFSEGPIAFPDPSHRPGRTMLTSEGSLNRSTHIVCDPKTGHLRKLTPVECERLNGFPDGWTDTGMPQRQRYFVMGNALVVPLITRMGDALLNRLR